MYRIETDYKRIDQDQWNEFLSFHPSASVFHTPEIVSLYELTEKLDPVVLFCTDENDIIRGLLIGVIQQEMKRFFRRISTRIVVHGSPLALNDDREIIRKLLHSFTSFAKGESVYIQFRNTTDTQYIKGIFSEYKYIFHDHLNIVIDLSKDLDLLWNEIHPTRRKQINRSIKRGVITGISEYINPDEVSTCFHILKDVYEKAKLPYPNLQFFQDALKTFYPRGYIRIALAKYEEKIIAFRFVLCYKGIIYDWYAGSRTEFHDKYPNDLLPWEIIQWGKKSRFSIFDFGGAGDPGKDYGVRDYKKKFGGTVVNHGRYNRINNAILYGIATTGFRFWQKLRRSL